MVEGPNAAGEPGRWIINYFDKNGDGKFTDDEIVSAQFVRDGKDGKSPEVTTKDNGDGTHTITIKNPNGTTTTTTIKDGKDGKAPVVETNRVEDADPNTPGNQAGTKIIVKDPETGKVISETFVKDGQDGKDGENGLDGKTFAPVVEKGQDGVTTIKFYPVDPKTGKPDTKQAAIAEGSVKDGKDGKSPVVETSRVDDVDPNTPGNQAGTKITVKDPETGATVHESFVKDGQDGQSPEVSTKDNGDGTHTITIKNPDGTTTTTTVKDGKNGEKGQDGRDGIDGKTFAPVVEKGADGTTTIKFYPVDPKTGKPDISQPAVAEGAVKDGKDGKSPEASLKDNDDGSHTITIKNPDGTTATTTVKDGKDGKSSEVTTKDNGDGTHTITIKNPDGTTTTTTIKDGKDGQNGKDGIDGKTFAPVVEKGQDGTTTIKFYPVDPKTGKPDTSQAAVAEGAVKDGRDGKSPEVTLKDNGDGSHTITVKNPDGTSSTTTVKNGKDGKSPEVTTKDNGDGTHTITIKNPDGTTTTTTVKDGKDGLNGKDGIDGKTFAPVVEKGQDGTTTIKFYPVDPKTGKPDTSQAAVAEGSVKDGKDGRDGKDGKDGKSPQVSIQKNNDGTHTITIKNPDGTTTTSTVKDGKDGKSPEVTTKDNGDGSHTITIKNPDGTSSSLTIRNGKDGKDGRDGKNGQSQRIRTEKGKDSQGNSGVWVIITDDKAMN
ncbi:hypothetical protein ODY27_02915 [Aerococcus sp. CDC-1871-U94]|nr:hypothetical protein [Aerococcus sp. Group 1]